MARRKTLILSQPVKDTANMIKVRLDPRTIVLLKSMKAFAFWKERYPNAEVIK